MTMKGGGKARAAGPSSLWKKKRSKTEGLILFRQLWYPVEGGVRKGKMPSETPEDKSTPAG